jgi:hypothetical protein
MYNSTDENLLGENGLDFKVECPDFIIEDVQNFIFFTKTLLTDFDNSLIIEEDFGGVYGFVLNKLENIYIPLEVFQHIKDLARQAFNPNIFDILESRINIYFSIFDKYNVRQLPFYTFVYFYCDIISDFVNFSENEINILFLLQSHCIVELRGNLPKVFDFTSHIDHQQNLYYYYENSQDTDGLVEKDQFCFILKLQFLENTRFYLHIEKTGGFFSDILRKFDSYENANNAARTALIKNMIRREQIKTLDKTLNKEN